MTHAFSKKDNPLVADMRKPESEEEKKARIAQKALDRKRFKQEHEAINTVLDALEPLEVDSRLRVLRSAAHFLGAGHGF